MLDVVYEDDAVSKNESIKGVNESLIFTYKRVVYRLLYDDINYIEKENNIKRCIIHTDNDNYYIVSSIDNLMKILKGNFIKSHQSGIINVDNIKALDCVNNQIVFKNNDVTSLITEKMKKEIKELMLGS